MNFFRSVPSYVWTLLALIAGIVSGGMFNRFFTPVAGVTTGIIKFIVTIVPFLIFTALSPAFAALVKRGLAGKFAGSVILWFVGTSMTAGLLGLIVSALFFGIPLTGGESGLWQEIVKMFGVFREQGGASYPLLAIICAMITGIISVWIKHLYVILTKIEKAIGKFGNVLGYAMIPILFCLGITIGVNFGAKLGMSHFLSITLYTFVLCIVLSLVYFMLVIKFIAKGKAGKLLTEYYIPTALFAAGTISSLVTFPVNLTNVKKYGVRDEVADFVISFGAVTNMDASALINIAFAPFIVHYVFGVQMSWTVLLIAWPAVVLFTIAAPGLPAGMGTALWASTLFTSMLGIEEPVKSSLITTWVVLYGGVPDMFITAGNCTGDGFTAVIFDRFFHRFLKSGHKNSIK